MNTIRRHPNFWGSFFGAFFAYVAIWALASVVLWIQNLS